MRELPTKQTNIGVGVISKSPLQSRIYIYIYIYIYIFFFRRLRGPHDSFLKMKAFTEVIVNLSCVAWSPT